MLMRPFAKFLVASVLIIGVLPGQSQNPTKVKEGIVDTLKFLGTCQYMAKTRSIIATAYYKFKVVNVLEGNFVGDTIVFEADANSINEKFLSSYIIGNKADMPTEILFPEHAMPIQNCFYCQSNLIEVEVAKLVEDRWWKGDTVTTYFKLWNPPPIKK